MELMTQVNMILQPDNGLLLNLLHLMIILWQKMLLLLVQMLLR